MKRNDNDNTPTCRQHFKSKSSSRVLHHGGIFFRSNQRDLLYIVLACSELPAGSPKTSYGSNTLTQMKTAFEASRTAFESVLVAHREASKPKSQETNGRRKKKNSPDDCKMPSPKESRKYFEATFATHQPQAPLPNPQGSAHSGLLSLPIELRYKIWGYVITSSTGLIDLQHHEGRPDLALS